VDDPDQAPSETDVRETWDTLAGFWDSKMEAGETWQRTLIAPSVENLLKITPGERVLELACGNGEFARRLTELGATVVATDFSESMLAIARGHRGGIDYRHVDAANAHELSALEADGPFDAAVVNMAIMDMITIEPMAAALPSLVRPGGRLVISTLHPSFNSGELTRVTEQTEDATGVVRTYSIKRSGYITPTTSKGVAVEGQPLTQWYFHRPLKLILEPFFTNGWVLDGLDEPVLDPPATLFDELPGVLVMRFRHGGGGS
jgi:2-polyprenyl-3-methyl-5-hydroxy-6-metoxy-1,4-benzoquinol methylase